MPAVLVSRNLLNSPKPYRPGGQGAVACKDSALPLDCPVLYVAWAKSGAHCYSHKARCRPVTRQEFTTRITARFQRAFLRWSLQAPFIFIYRSLYPSLFSALGVLPSPACSADSSAKFRHHHQGAAAAAAARARQREGTDSNTRNSHIPSGGKT